MRVAAFILGLIAGLSGFIVMIFEASVGGLDNAVNHTTGGLEGLAALVLIASIVAIVGGAFMLTQPKMGAWLTLIAMVLGFIGSSAFWIFSGILLLAATLLGFAGSHRPKVSSAEAQDR